MEKFRVYGVKRVPLARNAFGMEFVCETYTAPHRKKKTAQSKTMTGNDHKRGKQGAQG